MTARAAAVPANDSTFAPPPSQCASSPSQKASEAGGMTTRNGPVLRSSCLQGSESHSGRDQGTLSTGTANADVGWVALPE